MAIPSAGAEATPEPNAPGSKAQANRRSGPTPPASPPSRAGKSDLLCEKGSSCALLPRSGCTAQPRVAQRTLGTGALRSPIYPEGVGQDPLVVVQPLRGKGSGSSAWDMLPCSQGALRDPGLRCATASR